MPLRRASPPSAIVDIASSRVYIRDGGGPFSQLAGALMNRHSTWLLGSLAAIFIVFQAAPALALGTWSETGNGGGDAGDLFSTAQTVTGSGPLDMISGSTATGVDGDLYKISIPNPASFVATTVGQAGFDSILYLFDLAGHVWVAQDDDVGLQSTIFFGGGLPVPPAGEFYLGITPFNLNIENAAGVTFFDAPGFVGTSATSPVTGNSIRLWHNASWEFDHFEYLGSDNGPYNIVLTGARFAIPEPATWGLVAMASGALARRRRMRGATTNSRR